MYQQGQGWGRPGAGARGPQRGLLESLQNPWGAAPRPQSLMAPINRSTLSPMLGQSSDQASDQSTVDQASDQSTVDPAFDIGGVPQYPFAPQVDPNLPVYRPEIQKGLMDDEAGQDLVSKFAGGLLNGMQVREPARSATYGQMPGTQSTNMGFSGPNAMTPSTPGPTGTPAIAQQGYDGTGVYATNPSGVFTSEAPEEGSVTQTAEVNPGVFNTMDLMRFQQAMGQGAAGADVRGRTGATMFSPEQFFQQDGTGWKWKDFVQAEMDKPTTTVRGGDQSDPQNQLRWAMNHYGDEQSLMGE